MKKPTGRDNLRELIESLTYLYESEAEIKTVDHSMYASFAGDELGGTVFESITIVSETKGEIEVKRKSNE